MQSQGLWDSENSTWLWLFLVPFRGFPRNIPENLEKNSGIFPEFSNFSELITRAVAVSGVLSGVPEEHSGKSWKSSGFFQNFRIFPELVTSL